MTNTLNRDRYPVLSVEEAREHILDQVSTLGSERVPILQALGRVLAEDVCATENIPPHTNSAMDGYAVRHQDLIGSAPRLRVIGSVPAGSIWKGSLEAGQALRIMTGAPLPPGADTVVRFEDTRLEEEHVIILKSPSRGRNVRSAGEDVRAGQRVLERGQVLRPQEIGMLAALGRPTVAVYRRPRVALLATGDEVVGIEATLAPGKIRNSNSYSNAAQALQAGGEPLVLEETPDEANALVHRLRQALELGADLIVSSGGVSVGDFDLVKEVLKSEGEIDFWWVNMKPGKPMAFGTLHGVPLLALPGNPVAAMISFLLFARPAILKMLGYRRWDLPMTRAKLAQEIARKDGRRHYLRVRLVPEGDSLVAYLTGDQGSGILSSMVKADGLAIIPETVQTLPAGSVVQVIRLDACQGALTP